MFTVCLFASKVCVYLFDCCKSPRAMLAAGAGQSEMSAVEAVAGKIAVASVPRFPHAKNFVIVRRVPFCCPILASCEPPIPYAVLPLSNLPKVYRSPKIVRTNRQTFSGKVEIEQSELWVVLGVV